MPIDASDITKLVRMQRALTPDWKQGSSMQQSVVFPKQYSVLPNLLFKNGISFRNVASGTNVIVDLFREITTSTNDNTLVYKLQTLCKQERKFGLLLIYKQDYSGILTYTGNYYPVSDNIVLAALGTNNGQVPNNVLTNRRIFVYSDQIYPLDSNLKISIGEDILDKLVEYLNNPLFRNVESYNFPANTARIILLDKYPTIEL